MDLEGNSNSGTSAAFLRAVVGLNADEARKPPLVKERVGNFLCGLSIRKDEVKGRCRTVPKAEGFLRVAHPTLALV